MFNNNFEFTTNLQYQVKSLTARVEEFESGEKYVKMRSAFKGQLSREIQEKKKLMQEVADTNLRSIRMRENWFKVMEDVEKEHAQELIAKKRENDAIQKKLLNTEIKLAQTKDRMRDLLKELYQVKIELEEERGKNQKLTNQINKDYENSSIPSSMKPGHKKIPNSREKTGRKPGGQPGHKGHSRRKLIPKNRIHIPAPKEYIDNPAYRPTGRTITKQMINLHINVDVDEYDTPEYIHVRTRQRVHADFPDGVINDVNYGGSVKSFAFLLNSRCFVPIDKVREFISELTDGELRISKGMINGLCKEFSRKTKEEQKSIFSDLLRSPVMNADFTGARLNGKNVHVLVCATPNRVMYFAREHKGHKGVEDTPVEHYMNTLVHDHDMTFFNYGRRHQDCLSHVLRYLIGSIAIELNLTWNKQMRALLQEMIHYRNRIDDDTDLDIKIVEGFVIRYEEILETAKKEYEYEPPSDYCKEGYNLYRRLEKYKDNHLLFLRDLRVPATNNLAERLLRIMKRKAKQVMAFRSIGSLSYLCDSMGIIELFRIQDRNIYKSVASVFANDTAYRLPENSTVSDI